MVRSRYARGPVRALPERPPYLRDVDKSDLYLAKSWRDIAADINAAADLLEVSTNFLSQIYGTNFFGSDERYHVRNIREMAQNVHKVAEVGTWKSMVKLFPEMETYTYMTKLTGSRYGAKSPEDIIDAIEGHRPLALLMSNNMRNCAHLSRVLGHPSVLNGEHESHIVGGVVSSLFPMLSTVITGIIPQLAPLKPIADNLIGFLPLP